MGRHLERNRSLGFLAGVEGGGVYKLYYGQCENGKLEN